MIPYVPKFRYLHSEFLPSHLRTLSHLHRQPETPTNAPRQRSTLPTKKKHYEEYAVTETRSCTSSLEIERFAVAPLKKVILLADTSNDE